MSPEISSYVMGLEAPVMPVVAESIPAASPVVALEAPFEQMLQNPAVVQARDSTWETLQLLRLQAREEEMRKQVVVNLFPGGTISTPGFPTLSVFDGPTSSIGIANAELSVLQRPTAPAGLVPIIEFPISRPSPLIAPQLAA